MQRGLEGRAVERAPVKGRTTVLGTGAVRLRLTA